MLAAATGFCSGEVHHPLQGYVAIRRFFFLALQELNLSTSPPPEN